MLELVKLAHPAASAKYVVMQTFQDNAAPGFRQTWYPWPYTEGLTIEEANNELTFLVTGMYGKPALKQMGAPAREMRLQPSKRRPELRIVERLMRGFDKAARILRAHVFFPATTFRQRALTLRS